MRDEQLTAGMTAKQRIATSLHAVRQWRDKLEGEDDAGAEWDRGYNIGFLSGMCTGLEMALEDLNDIEGGTPRMRNAVAGDFFGAGKISTENKRKKAAFQVYTISKDTKEKVFVGAFNTRAEAETFVGIEGTQMEAENVGQWIIEEAKA